MIRAEATWSQQKVEEVCTALRIFFTHEDAAKAGIVALMSHLLPTFTHLETGKGLDDKM